jgi:CRISPR-associated protein Cmr3
MAHLMIEPLDYLTFRDGRPFMVGQDFFRRTIFPPHPRTIMGMLRTRMLLETTSDIDAYYRGDPSSASARELAGDPDWDGDGAGESPSFSLGPIYLVRRSTSETTFFLPTPMDFWVHKSNSSIDYAIAGPMQQLSARTDLPHGLLPIGLRHEARFSPVSEPWIDIGSLEALLAGLAPGSPKFGKEHLAYHRGRRHGIALDTDRRAALDEHLYLMETIEMNRRDEQGGAWSLCVEVKADKDVLMKFPGMARLGGDGRPVMLELLGSSIYMPGPAGIEQTGKYLKYCLVSPAIYCDGSGLCTPWPPFFAQVNGRLEGKLPGSDVKLRLVASVVGRPLPAGGWNIKKGQGRPIEWAVPAGSTFFFEVTQGNGKEAIQTLHGKSFSKYALCGFGVGIVGKYDSI